MGTATTTKPVNLYQLGLEIGGSPSFRVRGDLDADGDVKDVRCDAVSDAELEAALDAHDADPSIVPPPPPPTKDEQDRDQFAAVRDKLRAVRAGEDTLTNAQAQQLLARIGLWVMRQIDG